MDRLALSLARRYLLSCRWDSLEEGVLRWLFRHFVTSRIAGRQERQRGVNSRPLPLSEEAEKGLRWYLEGPLQNQIQTERGRVPDRVTFVFGHTHRPFEFLMDSQIASEPLRIVNTGGWVVDTRTPRPWHGGAVALLDEHLNAVSVRFGLDPAVSRDRRNIVCDDVGGVDHVGVDQCGSVGTVEGS
jgi:hypothetical protein